MGFFNYKYRNNNYNCSVLNRNIIKHISKRMCFISETPLFITLTFQKPLNHSELKVVDELLSN